MALEDSDKPREFTVTLQQAAHFDIDSSHLYETFREVSDTMPALQAMDVILRHLPSLRMELIGRSFFSESSHPYLLGSGRELWPGYYQSVKP